MNRLLTILLLAAGTAYGQIDNPPTSVNIVDATATGRAVLTATNAAAAATAVGLGTTNNVTFSNITANGIINAKDSTASPATNSTLARGIQWTNLGGSGVAAIYGSYPGVPQIYLAVGATNALTDVATFRATGMTVNSNAIVGGTLAVSNAATFSTNVTVNGNLSVGSLTTTTPSTWALDATQTAAATNGILALPSNANVIRLTNNNAISGVSGGVLGAFYYLVNQTTNAVTISNVGGITVQGGTSLTLGANQAATLVATGSTNASVAARGDLNDVTLGGTLNKAPAQTADSADSLMTRDLSDDRYSFSRWYDANDLLSGAQNVGVNPLITGNGSGHFANAILVTVSNGNTKFMLPVDYRVSGEVKVVSYWTDRTATNSGTNGDIAVWTFPFLDSPTNNMPAIANAGLTLGTQIQNTFTANYGGSGNTRFYVMEQTLNFATVTNISATNPLQLKWVELQRRGADASDTSADSIYLSGVHIYVP